MGTTYLAGAIAAALSAPVKEPKKLQDCYCGNRSDDGWDDACYRDCEDEIRECLGG